jgi:hypothetical protein
LECSSEVLVAAVEKRGLTLPLGSAFIDNQNFADGRARKERKKVQIQT